MKSSSTLKGTVLMVTVILLSCFGAFSLGKTVYERMNAGERSRRQIIYEEGLLYLSNEEFDKAAEAFADILDYRDADELLAHAIKMRDASKSGNSILSEDEKTMVSERATEEGSNASAPDSSLKNMAAAASVGSTIEFGSYEMDGLDNGRERIPWKVVYQNEDRILLVSQYCLESMPFGKSGGESVTWDHSQVKEWLNGPFYRTAFTKEEQDLIDCLRIDYSGNYVSDMGSETEDKVFILSLDEVEMYLYGDAWTGVKTNYVRKNTDDEFDTMYLSYWTRDTEFSDAWTAGHSTWHQPYLESACAYTNGIRPAIWLRISE